MPALILNGRKFLYEEILKSDSNWGTTDFEKSTLAFCKAWLGGEQEFYIRTSGSTGKPKEITLARKAMEASARMTIKALQLKPAETSLVCLDTQYIAGQMMLVRSLINEMTIIALEPSSNPFEKRDSKIDFVALVPYQLENILSQSLKQIDTVRCAIIGGAPINDALRSEVKKTKCSVYATYGMTETISHVALQKLNGDNAQDYFEALDQVRLQLDERGCLCIRVPHLPSQVITNDLVELIDEKNFRWLGRTDHVINSGGIKIIPEKVELVFDKILNALSINNKFFITGVADEKWGQRVVAFVEGQPFLENEQKKILEMATEKLGKYEVPQEFIFINKFIETANGKINRRSIVSAYKK